MIENLEFVVKKLKSIPDRVKIQCLEQFGVSIERFRGKREELSWKEKLLRIAPGREQFQEYETTCTDILKICAGRLFGSLGNTGTR